MSGKSACPVLRGAWSSTEVWTRYCGTAAKAGGKLRTQTSSCSFGRLLPTRRIVYKALDLKLNREVALKVLPPELVSDPDRKRRFVQEAQAAAALKHPNIAVVYEIDEVDGVDFIAMSLQAVRPIRGRSRTALQ